MKYRRELSSRELELAERSQVLGRVPLIGTVYNRGRTYLTGSDSASFAAAAWQRAEHVQWPAEREDWHFGIGNPEAGRFPRSWRKALILAAGTTALQAAYHSLDRATADDAQPAAAFNYLGQTHVGVLPKGFGVIPPRRTGGEELHGAALREGREPIAATLGFYLPSERTLVVPEGVAVIDCMVPTERIAELYPELPLS